MLKYSITIFLTSLIVLQTFAPFVMFAVFYANQKAITEKYCVNKSKPKLHCNGKCFLSKKLSNQMDAQLPQNDKETEFNYNIKIEPYTFSVNYLVASCSIFFSKNYFPFKSIFWKNNTEKNIFHPPCC